eukprot:9021194-Lingulodinium_polyedra.AAC.1
MGSSCSGVYHCHIDLFWIDPQFIAMAGVPIREEAVNQAVDHAFGNGGINFPSTLGVAARDPD